jgi:putative ABC transport system permease protein
MKKTLDSFGTDVIVVEKWPWAPEEGTEFAWWEYLNRPVVTMREYETLKNRMTKIHAACFLGVTGSEVEYLDNRAENLQIWGVSEEFEGIRSFNLASGRFLTAVEISSGRNICVIGYNIAQELFRGENPLGKTIRFKGKNASVVGVFSKEGKSLLGGGSMDNIVLIPVRFFSLIADMTTDNANPQIWIKPVESVSVNEMIEDLKLNMRSIRRLGPRHNNNFALNKTSLMSGMIEQIFSVVNIAGWFIGIFAVLVGAFGIANIMFVSVKERTNIIGIQKSLGAKSYYIILEVLNESVLLSLIGGLLGLLLIYIGTFIAKSQGFEIFLSAGNIITGLLISSTVGLFAGLMPALTAARLDPVKAMASTF